MISSIVQVTPMLVRNVVETLIGTPYRHLGRNIDTGLDCFGLVIEFFRRLGITQDDPVSNYSREWWKTEDFIEFYHRIYFDRVINPFPGAIVSMCINSIVPNHLAI